jgi:AhpD family alkylhydroperoxidase
LQGPEQLTEDLHQRIYRQKKSNIKIAEGDGTMSKEAIQERVNEFFEYSAKFSQKYPEIGQSFMGLMGSIMQDGKVKSKEKELIALGIAVGLRCVPCIYAHTSASLRMGATPEEILEAASVAVLMQGGPGMAHLMEVMKALEAFADNK